MNEKTIHNASKYLSLILRHQPELIGLELDAQGWADVDQLLEKWNGPTPMERTLLEHIVATNNKKRFALDETGLKIRASQGHSVDIDLQLVPQTPPDILYHGTVGKFLPAIKEQGLLKMSRKYVHLSGDLATASAVGGRRGKPVLLTIKTKEMFAGGYVFYLSDNLVWLTDHVPPSFIQFPA